MHNNTKTEATLRPHMIADYKYGVLIKIYQLILLKKKHFLLMVLKTIHNTKRDDFDLTLK